MFFHRDSLLWVMLKLGEEGPQQEGNVLSQKTKFAFQMTPHLEMENGKSPEAKTEKNCLS